MPFLRHFFSKERRLARKMAAYQPLVPPFDKPPILFSAEETKAYYAWYMEHLPERCDYLREKAASGLGCRKSAFDYSFDSLIPLWDWFLLDAETEIRSRERALLPSGYPGAGDASADFFNGLIEDRREEPLLSIYSEMVLRDIGMYWGQTFLRMCPDVLKWDCKRTPRNYIHVNEPLVTGFVNLYGLRGERLARPVRLDFEPIHYAGVQAVKLLDRTATRRDLYKISMLHLPHVEMARLLLQEKQSAQ